MQEETWSEPQGVRHQGLLPHLRHPGRSRPDRHLRSRFSTPPSPRLGRSSSPNSSLKKNWDPTSPEKAEYGILSMIVSTLMVTGGALLLAVPIGIGVAAYLSDVAHWRVREIVKPVVEILAGIPSVVVGFLGIVLFGPAIAKIFHIGNGLNALNGSSCWPSCPCRRSSASPRTPSTPCRTPTTKPPWPSAPPAGRRSSG